MNYIVSIGKDLNYIVLLSLPALNLFKCEKPPKPITKDNTIPNMVWVHDGDGQKDIVASHVGWSKGEKLSDGADHPYVAWYKGPSFTKEFIMIDRNTPGLNENSRIYRFVMYDVDKHVKKPPRPTTKEIWCLY